MKSLVITIGDKSAQFDIDLDAGDAEREVSMEYGHRKATTSLMGLLRALGLVTFIEELPLIRPEDLHIK